MPDQTKIKKVDISFTNWMLGGSLVSVTDDQGRRRTSSRKVAVLEVADGKPVKAATVEKKSGDAATTQNSTGEDKKSKKQSKELDGKEEKKKEGVCGSKKCCRECGQASDDDKAGKTDDAKKDKSGSDSSRKEAATGANGFTTAQDTKLMEMKAANKSWKEIIVELGASKKDVTTRFKELSDAKNKKAEGVAKKDGSSEGASADTAGLDFSNLFLDDNCDTTTKEAGKKEDGKKDRGGGKEDRKKKKRGNDGDKDNWNRGGPAGDSARDGTGTYPELKPNANWSEADCDLLMFMEARYMEEKWLQMQAGFFNWTGRMIDAEIIKAKFAEDGLI